MNVESLVRKNKRNEQKVDEMMLVMKRISKRKMWKERQKEKRMKWRKPFEVESAERPVSGELKTTYWEKIVVNLCVCNWWTNDAFPKKYQQQSHRRSFLCEILNEK
jgi:hypothetical protein